MDPMMSEESNGSRWGRVARRGILDGERRRAPAGASAQRAGPARADACKRAFQCACKCQAAGAAPSGSSSSSPLAGVVQSLLVDLQLIRAGRPGGWRGMAQFKHCNARKRGNLFPCVLAGPANFWGMRRTHAGRVAAGHHTQRTPAGRGGQRGGPAQAAHLERLRVAREQQQAAGGQLVLQGRAGGEKHVMGWGRGEGPACRGRGRGAGWPGRGRRTGEAGGSTTCSPTTASSASQSSLEPSLSFYPLPPPPSRTKPATHLGRFAANDLGQPEGGEQGAAHALGGRAANLGFEAGHCGRVGGRGGRVVCTARLQCSSACASGCCCCAADVGAVGGAHAPLPRRCASTWPHMP